MQYNITMEKLARDLGLNYRFLYLLSNHIPDYYKIHQIPKKNGKFRTIEAPAPILKRIQKYILHYVLPVHQVGNGREKTRKKFAATAFETGCSIKRNALPHCGKAVIVSLDVKNFFPSLRYHYVLELLKQCVCEENFAVMLAKFCTFHGHLPQGAITSPHISNLLLENIDASLHDFCLSHKLEFTRYADDLTFSGNPSNEEITELIRLCRAELKRIGLKLNEEKTRILRTGMRQEVTGLVVNSKLNVPREDRRLIRQQMYYLNKFWEQKCHEFDEHSLNILLGKVNFIWDLNRNNFEFCEYRKQLLEIKHYFDCQRNPVSI